ncbi:MAG TPA: S8 family peptidase [Pyrinomonadaceae bacterium]|jgi:subtilisin family serine protease|nr:S8 family peptidase [Pyrinomonadaceae bacterium]
MKKVFAFVITLAIGAAALTPAFVQGRTPVGADGDGAGKQKYKANEILIQFKPGASDADIASARSYVGAFTKKQLKRAARLAAKGDLELAVIQSGLTVEQAVSIIETHPAVAFAEPNWIVRHQATSTDTYYTNGNLWGMYGDATSPANVYGSQAGEAWAAGHTGSSSVYVGVIDEGIDYEHIDLAANVWTNPFDPVDGVDNDGNGFADDAHGWDFFQDNNSVYDGVRPSDYDTDLHGTHVAGTIGALSNGRGVVGVNWNVTMISAKFLGPDGGSVADAIDAINYFIDLKTRHGLNIVALNNSWGGGGYSQALHDAVIRAAKANILFTAAAGNGNLAGIGQNNDKVGSYPSNYNTTVGTSTESAASYDAVIAVAALTSTGALAKYSNYGLTTVDIGAPGSGVWSTSPNNTLTRLDGTSMATPHVTGGIALYAASHPGATPQQIRSAVLTTGVATSSLANKTVTGKRLNVSTF